MPLQLLHNKHKEKEEQPRQILSAITYYGLIPFIYIISLLPFKALYLFSDFLYLLFFRVIGYRKKVVMQNLRNSFPEKGEPEIKIICSNFYHSFCDSILETIKLATISKKSLLARCKPSPAAAELLSSFAGENKSVIIAMGHMGNWEWACDSFNIVSQHQLYVIYHPVSNKYFDHFMARLRSRSGTKLIPMKNTYREMAANKTGLNATVFVADQTPQPEHAYWTTFLNQDTPVFKGMEVIAKKMNLPVIYTSIRKIKRGYYEMHAEVLSKNPAGAIDGALSDRYMKRLEQDIFSQPETWLWSHRRWKHKRPVAISQNTLVAQGSLKATTDNRFSCCR